MWTIKNVSTMTGIGVHTLRAWEKRYGLVHPKRNENGRRLYNDDEVEGLELLATLTKSGTPIGQLASLSKVELKKLVNELPDDKRYYESIGKLQSSLLILKKAIELNVKEVIEHEYSTLNNDLEAKKYDYQIFLKEFALPLYQWVLKNEKFLNYQEHGRFENIMNGLIMLMKTLFTNLAKIDITTIRPGKILIGSSGGVKGEMDSLVLGIKSYLGGKNILFIGSEINENKMNEILNQMVPEKIILTDRFQNGPKPIKVLEMINSLNSDLSKVEFGLLIHNQDGEGMESPFCDGQIKTFSSFDSIEKFMLAS